MAERDAGVDKAVGVSAGAVPRLASFFFVPAFPFFVTTFFPIFFLTVCFVLAFMDIMIRFLFGIFLCYI